MAANGIDVKRGILFHGVPGTGKSFIANLLASELEGFTTILCSGENLERPAAVFKLARRFAPSLVLFEDIDLVGSRREENRSLTVLRAS
jgi:ATP-dependent 26S proteasome regulatory subunit